MNAICRRGLIKGGYLARVSGRDAASGLLCVCVCACVCVSVYRWSACLREFMCVYVFKWDSVCLSGCVCALLWVIQCVSDPMSLFGWMRVSGSV